MKFFKNRDYSLTEEADYTLNIRPLEGSTGESVPAYIDGVLVGWFIQPRYE
jgi:hypothetical protein